MNREDKVMELLDVFDDDAIKIVRHLKKLDLLDWIDEYDKEYNDMLTDVHWERNFEEMIDWIFEGCKPSEMLGRPEDINDYKCMLELDDGVIFWYGIDN